MMARKRITYTTLRLNKNLERVTADGSKRRREAERNLNSALLALQYASSRFSDYQILSRKLLVNLDYLFRSSYIPV